MVVGRAAEEARTSGTSAERLAVLPVWLWLPPMSNMGRKGRGLVPVRVSYEGGPLVILEDNTEVKVDWTAVGAGWDLSSQVLVSGTRAGAGTVTRPTPGRSPSELHDTVLAEHLGPACASRRLDALATDGQAARWEIVGDLQRMAEKYVWRARTAALASLQGRADDLLGQLFSREDVDALVNELVLGAGGGRGRVDSLLERCLQPSTFERVDPLRYVSTSLRCSARQLVNKRLGDPDVGPEVRRLSEQLGLPSHRALTGGEVSLVLEHYQGAHPESRLGAQRATAATKPRLLSNAFSEEPQYQQPPSLVDSYVQTVVSACREEGGALLGEVAQCWLSRAVAGDEPTPQDLAKELWLDTPQVSRLIAKVRAIGAKLLGEGDAA